MTTRTRTNGLPTMTRSETAAWIALARTGRLHAAMNRPDWPETLAALAARVEAEDARAAARYQNGPEPERWFRLAAMTAEVTERALALAAQADAAAAALSTQPVTWTYGDEHPQAPQAAPSRPPKR